MQWLPVLRALAQQLVTHSSAQDLRALFVKVGSQFASDVEDHFQEIQTLSQLEEALNGLWAQTNWGWVTLSEAGGGISIDHEAAPLAEAFGEECLEWSTGLLEGFYQSVFSVLGASDTMRVREASAPEGMAVHLRFGR
ncbi:cellulose biosynthesis protein BcsD [Rhodoferax aquaticus]|nr:cellulose biosynthesis protein BcsD [Rhodoferax aquaticus]